jgi:hypothetical protein
VLAEADLEGLLLVALESSRTREVMATGDYVQLKVFSGFSNAKGGIRIGIWQIGSPYLGLNSPTSRRVWGRQQSRSVTSAATHASYGPWSVNTMWFRFPAIFDSLPYFILI